MPNKKTQMTVLKYFLGHIGRYKLLFTIILIAAGSGVLLNDILAPYFYKQLIDIFVAQHELLNKKELLPSLWHILFILLSLYLIAEVFLWRIGGFCQIWWQTKIIKNITDDCFARLQKHSFDFFANNFTGSLVAKVKRIYRAFERITDIIIWEFLTNFVRILFSVILLYTVSPIFTLILSVWSVIYLIILFKFSFWKMQYDLAVAECDSRITGKLADAITNAIPIKLFAQLRYEKNNLGQITEEKRKTEKFNWNIGELFSLVAGTNMVFIEIIMIYFAIKLWVINQITAGDVILIQSLLMAILTHLWHLRHSIRNFYSSLSDAQEMIDIFNTEIKIQNIKNPQKCKIKKGAIEFQNLSFAYDGQKVFQNLNLSIPAGRKIGIVGESGAGKTTLTKLLFRFVDPDQGRILIDGQDISKIKQNDLRRNISFVPQEPILFHRSIFDNIHYGRFKATEKEVQKAARDAQAHNFIMKTAQQYQTFVGERGIKLSGGEKQRIAIARAMLKNTPILILDEATSSLDSRAETAIQKALKKLMQNRTTLVIAHRLSTLRAMDEIIVFEEGHIIEHGTHEKLIQIKNGKYAQLWKYQKD